MNRALLVLLALSLLSAAAFAGIRLVPNTNRREFDNCAATGSTGQVIPNGSYLFRVTDENTWLCWSTTCSDGGGEVFPNNTLMLLDFSSTDGGTDVSCHSAGATGDAILTPAFPQ